MINRVILVGRLTRDPMLRKTQSGLSVATFTVACDRRFSGGNGQDSCWNRNRLLKIVLQRWAISRRMLAMLRRTRSGTLRRTMDSMISALARHWIFPAMTYHFN